MSNQDGDRFAGGFLAGTIFGSVVGGLVGTWLATKLIEAEDDADSLSEGSSPASIAKEQFKRIRQRVLNATEEPTVEEARQGLEDKISQLNDAIDLARQQLSKVNGSGTPEDF
jgi:rhamnogalacturonyl hydrolase YesR